MQRVMTAVLGIRAKNIEIFKWSNFLPFLPQNSSSYLSLFISPMTTGVNWRNNPVCELIQPL